MKKKAEDGAEIKTSSDYALKIVSLTGIVFFLIFSVVYLLKGDLFAGIVEITIAFTFFLNLIFLTKHKNIDSASSFVEIRQALASYILLNIFIYFYQKGNESKQKLVEEKEKEVNKRQEEL